MRLSKDSLVLLLRRISVSPYSLTVCLSENADTSVTGFSRGCTDCNDSDVRTDEPVAPLSAKKRIQL